MQYLLDTCTYIWAITDRNKLSKKAVNVLSSEDNQIFVSIISQLETTIKHSQTPIDNLILPTIDYYQKYRIASGISLLNIKQEDIEMLGKLPPIHNDLYDKILVSQAINNGMIIISPDNKFSKYPVRTIY